MKESPWQRVEDLERLPRKIFEYVERVEREQEPLYQRFYKFNCLYDPYYDMLAQVGLEDPTDRRVYENFIASSVDTVVGLVATAEIRPRILLDGADWKAQRTAARLSWYVEGLGKLIGAHALAVCAFFEAALKGTGFAKVDVDWASGEIDAQWVIADDIVLPDLECRGGKVPRQLHHRQFVDKETLKQRHPGEDDAEAIDKAQAGAGTGSWASWAGYRPIEEEHVVVVESWYLPYGKRGSKNHKPGRHCKVIDNHVLLDEEYHEPYFPFAWMHWTKRSSGFFGIGGAERIAGHQRQANRLHTQVDRQQYKLANPTTWLQLPDANIAVRSVARLGDVGIYKAAMPVTQIPPAVSPETYARLERLREGAYEEFGVSRLAVSAKKDAGLYSGAAIREYRDASTQRFAPQEKAFEQLNLDIHWLALQAAKKLAQHKGTQAPTVVKKLASGPKKIAWSDVDLGEVRVQMQAAATLSRTPAGRTQMVQEWAQAGIITTDEARKLLAPFDPLDLDRAMSLYTAALENIDMTLEEGLDGRPILPEPFQNLKLAAWRGQAVYLQAASDGAPEEILEIVRQYVTQAAWIVANAAEPLPMPAPEQQTPMTAVAPEARQIAGIG